MQKLTLLQQILRYVYAHFLSLSLFPFLSIYLLFPFEGCGALSSFIFIFLLLLEFDGEWVAGTQHT